MSSKLIHCHLPSLQRRIVLLVTSLAIGIVVIGLAIHHYIVSSTPPSSTSSTSSHVQESINDAAVVEVFQSPTPSFFSSSPSNTPTYLYPTHPEPPTSKYTHSYFYNYNTTVQSNFGPHTWGDVNIHHSHFVNYWSEFDNPVFLMNQCNNSYSEIEIDEGQRHYQSPIDVCDQPAEHCVEFHEIRSRVSGGVVILVRVIVLLSHSVFV